MVAREEGAWGTGEGGKGIEKYRLVVTKNTGMSSTAQRI